MENLDKEEMTKKISGTAAVVDAEVIQIWRKMQRSVLVMLVNLQILY